MSQSKEDLIKELGKDYIKAILKEHLSVSVNSDGNGSFKVSIRFENDVICEDETFSAYPI
jgi:hypothetical protein